MFFARHVGSGVPAIGFGQQGGVRYPGYLCNPGIVGFFAGLGAVTPAPMMIASQCWAVLDMGRLFS